MAIAKNVGLLNKSLPYFGNCIKFWLFPIILFMRLSTTCISCHKSFKVKARARTRPDLQMKKGDYLKLSCPNCARQQEKHVNDIQTGLSPLLIIIGILAGILSCIFLWEMGFISTLSIIIPIIIWQQDTILCRAFNNYRVLRK
mgnify:CR=1 FL=1